MPSTSLRPRKQKTITTRRSADSIYSKLGFDFNPAQQDPESFKHNFYAHNMGRPDTPQHIRRLLRGLNRHVETQDRIASAKDVGELLNPDFKQAVKGMSRRQQQRRYKRWEKIPVSNFTARMNALKKIHEASIDHVTPEFMDIFNRANKVHRRLAPNKIKRLSYTKRGVPSQLELGTPRIKPGPINYVAQHATDSIDPNYDYIDIPPYPRNKKERNFSFDRSLHLAHELGHAFDPERRSSAQIHSRYNPEKKSNSFYAMHAWLGSPKEVHANSVETRVALQQAKGRSYSADTMRDFLRSGFTKKAYNNAAVENTAFFGKRKKLRDISVPIERMHFKGDRYRAFLNSKSKKSPIPERMRKRRAHKLFKEVNKGIEQVYGARNTTGGTTNKFGQVKLARPIGKLPESREELIERIIDAVTPGIERVSEKIPKKVGSARTKDSVPIDVITNNMDPIAGGKKIGTYGKRHGLDTPVTFKAVKNIGGTSATDNGQTIGAVTRQTPKGAEIHMSKEHQQLAKTHARMVGAKLGNVPQMDVAHELVHSQDKWSDANVHKQLQTISKFAHRNNPEIQGAAYLSNPSEVKAYGSTLGKYGAREMVKHGFDRKAAVTSIKAKPALIPYLGMRATAPVPNTVGQHSSSIPLRLMYGELGSKAVIQGLPSQMRRRAHKAHHQFFKALHQGVEQAYPQQTKAFRGGMLRASTKPRLPEELQEKFDDFNFRINRYGQPDFREVDRGKPGDHTHWNIYKPDKDPVLRPKDPVVRRPARAQMDTPKPSTARDRALAWRKRQGVQESFPNIDKKALMERVKNSNLSL